MRRSKEFFVVSIRGHALRTPAAALADQADRDRTAEALLRRRTPGATDLADFLDSFSIDDQARRQVVRLLGEMEASD